MTDEHIDQIRFLNEQIMYLKQALALEIADGKKARDEAASLRQELTLYRRLNELGGATDKESLTVQPTTEDSPADHLPDATKMIEEVQV